MIAKFITGTPDKLDYGLTTVIIRYEDRKDLYKKMRRYCNDMFETKGRELKRVNDLNAPDIYILDFCGRSIQFNRVK